MKIQRVYAHVCCSDLERSKVWFGKLFDREPDVAPMDGLVEWYHGSSAGLQLFKAAEHAGHSHMTVVVQDLEGERSRLKGEGLEVGEIEPADSFSLLILRDPDQNMIVLTQPL